MHHSSTPDPELSKKYDELTKELKLGPTGRYPDGKLAPSDEGEIAIAVAHTNTAPKKVVLDFGKPVAWIGFTPAQARDIASALMKHADEAEKA